MEGNDTEVTARFRRQHGVATRRQALADGLSARQITRRLQSGAWTRVAPGIYRHGAIAQTWPGEVLASCYRLGGLASHRSAASLHGFAGFAPGPIEITVARGRRRSTGTVVVHETTQLDRADPVWVGPVPATGVARTVLDLAAVVTAAELARTVDFVVNTNRATWSGLYSVLVEHCTNGRDGCHALRAALEQLCGQSGLSRQTRRALIGEHLERTFGAAPVPDYRLRSAQGAFVGLVDFAYPDQRVAYCINPVGHDARQRFTRADWRVIDATWSDYTHARVGSGGEWR